MKILLKQGGTSSRRAALLQKAGRILCIAIAFGAVAWSIDGVGSVLSGFSASSLCRETKPVADVPALHELFAGFPEGGTWTFNGLPWEVSAAFESTECESSVSREDPFFALPSEALQSPETDLLRFLHRIGHRSDGPRGTSVYRLNRPGVRLAATTAQSGGAERICVVRVSLDLDGRGFVLEGRPCGILRRPVSDRSAPWPLRVSCALHCSYRSPKREPLLYIASTTETVESFAAHWRDEGWNVKFDNPEESVFKELVCRRGKQAIRVGACQPFGNEESYVVIVPVSGAPAL